MMIGVEYSLDISEDALEELRESDHEQWSFVRTMRGSMVFASARNKILNKRALELVEDLKLTEKDLVVGRGHRRFRL